MKGLKTLKTFRQTLKRTLRQTLRRLFLVALFFVVLSFTVWVIKPIEISNNTVIVTIEPQSYLREIIQKFHESGMLLNPYLFEFLVRIQRADKHIKSGSYEFKAGLTPWDLLQKITLGDADQSMISIPEGWTLQRMRQEINSNADLRHDTAHLSDADLAKQLGLGADKNRVDKNNADKNLEGLFFPDTYFFAKGESDLSIYQRAYQLMQRKLSTAWQGRQENLFYKTPYEALILASLIEKETAYSADRPLVAAFKKKYAFANRPHSDLWIGKFI